MKGQRRRGQRAEGSRGGTAAKGEGGKRADRVTEVAQGDRGERIEGDRGSSDGGERVVTAVRGGEGESMKVRACIHLRVTHVHSHVTHVYVIYL